MLTYSVGELIDKLCVVHLKIWHIEERVEKIKDSKDEKDLIEIEKMLNQIVSLNDLRIKIIDSINEYLEKEDESN